ncbi:Endoribonuclease YbeY [Galdieria sulphuraria]|uniref:Metallopeptidase n=1 Tax=Galdieria sulphuraria TaxID=130081 RepID=M2VYQ8_GALSU|nr:metallopeptidase [Galdieria sulphuraria]EME28426.1 metallopeptidase [Galdieria sulphuraria]GJD12229.1 Endoribonuclease YbeY [Galdieria sulphuraria]|eukprot:XP_005704946.1 metallopeptidase [Galdieria sulphuraria]
MALVLCRLRKTLFLSKSKVEEMCYALLDHFQLKEYEYSVKLTTDRYIRLLNSQFRGIHGATDVLSFPTGLFQQGRLQPYSAIIQKELQMLHNDRIDHSFEVPLDSNVEFRDMGDVVISVPYVKRVAEKRGVLPTYQFASVLVHGFCHLLGYDHEEALDRDRMNQVERECLDTLTTLLDCRSEDLKPLTSQWLSRCCNTN